MTEGDVVMYLATAVTHVRLMADSWGEGAEPASRPMPSDGVSLRPQAGS